MEETRSEGVEITINVPPFIITETVSSLYFLFIQSTLKEFCHVPCIVSKDFIYHI